MVNLPENPTCEPSPLEEIFERYRNHRYLFLTGGPNRLIELEEFADVAYRYMKNTSNHPNMRQLAMNRVRQLFKLEFKMLCDICGTAHDQDEITAPER